MNTTENDSHCCSVESIITVDERGQMVLPKEIREKMSIKPGDKLALIGWEKNGEVCCLSLIKTKELGRLVRNVLKPMINNL